MEPAKEEMHCSTYCEQQQLPIIGTGRKPEESRDFGGYLLVEFSGSLEAKIELQDGLLGQIAEVMEQTTEVTGRVYRLQSVRDDHTSSSENYRLIFYRWQEEANREEYRVPSELLLDLLGRILQGDANELMVPSSVERDILVCTHAQRDKCCGRFGYPIYKRLTRETSPTTKIWRSSHITGHRAAPTMLDLPRGNFWGYMTEEVASLLVKDRELSSQQIRHHYRGGTHLTPPQQLVDREGFVEHGQAWFDSPAEVSERREGDRTDITIQRGELSISHVVGLEPDVIEVGETSCGSVKDVTSFDIIT